MAERRAVIAGTLGRTTDPDAPDDPPTRPPTVSGLALRLAFWVLIVLGGIYTITNESWRHNGVFSVRAAFWAIVMVNAVWQGWHRFDDLRNLRSHRHVVPNRRG
jgi:hypothetical protein